MRRWLRKRRARLDDLIIWLLSDHDKAGRDL